VNTRTFSIGFLVTAVVAGGVGLLAFMTNQQAMAESQDLYHQANSLFETRQYTQAEPLYAALLDRRTAAPYVAEAQYKLAQIYEVDGRWSDAANAWKAVAAAPGGASAQEIDYHQGLCAEHLGDADAANAFFTKVRTSGPTPYASMAAVSLGRLAEAQGDHEAAQRYFEAAVMESDERDTVLAAGAALRDINLQQFLRRDDDKRFATHLVRSGDNLQAIAERYGSTVDLIMEVNGIPEPSKLRVNQNLVIPRTDFHIVVNKSMFTLTLFDGDRIFGVYPVGLGKNGCTPVGSFEIKEKIKDPTWWSPNGPVPPGDPGNELGTRWMGMRALDPGIGEGYGIHATIRPETIGTEASNGCPRMYEKDAQELFRLVRVGTRVDVVPA